MLPPAPALLKIPFLLLLLLEVLCPVLGVMGGHMLLLALQVQAAPQAAQVVSARHFVFNGVLCLGLALACGLPLLRLWQGKRAWAGAYYEFNRVQLRCQRNARGELLLYLPDLLRALEIHSPAQQVRVCNLLQGTGGVHGAAPHLYLSLPILFDWLRKKEGRLARQFQQYLTQVPEFQLADADPAQAAP